MTRPPTPSTNDHLRAAISIKRASELVGIACAVARGTPERAPADPLIGLPDDCRADVARAARTILKHQAGSDEALRLLRLIDAADPYEVTAAIARLIEYDGWKALDAQRIARQHHRDHVDLAGLPETSDDGNDDD